MKFYIPQNLYAAIFSLWLPEELKGSVAVLPSSLISERLKTEPESIALLPSMDIPKIEGVRISRKLAVSFDGQLSNSYLYFIMGQDNLDTLYLKGDISTNEIILTKILFLEKYGIDLNIVLDTSETTPGEKNYLISGNENFDYPEFSNGISFSDQVADLIDYPYVNYVLASTNGTAIKNFTDGLTEVDKKIEDNLEKILENLMIKPRFKDFIRNNFDSVYYDLTENEVTGLNDLLRLPFYQGIFEEITELKFGD